jgi:hypothetical protein
MNELIIQKGSVFSREVKVYDHTGETRVAFNLTDITVMFTVKAMDDATDDDAAALIKKDITSHTNASGGITLLTLTAGETNISVGIYKADVRLWNSAGVCLNTERFSCRVVDIVTKRTS